METNDAPVMDTSGQSDSGIPPMHSAPVKHKQRWSLILVALVLIGTMGGVILSQQKSQDTRSRATNTGTTLALSPATKTAAIGETFTIGATINTNTDTVSAIELHLTYDPIAIQITGFTAGTPLPVALTQETHTNGNSVVILGARCTDTGCTPFHGAGIVGTWTIKILTAKQSSLQFTSSTAVAALGKTTNTLTSSTGARITVPSAPTNTPTPTIIPTTTLSSTPTPTTTPITTPTITVTITPQTLQGDITGEEGVPDGIVDLFDYNKILDYYIKHYGQTGTPGFTSEDITGEEGVPDGIVDLFDLHYITEHYGKTK